MVELSHVPRGTSSQKRGKTGETEDRSLVSPIIFPLAVQSYKAR